MSVPGHGHSIKTDGIGGKNDKQSQDLNLGPFRCSTDGALWHCAVVKPVWPSHKLKYLFSYHIMHMQCTCIHYSYVSTMQKAHSFDITCNLGFVAVVFNTEWKVTQINQRTTLLSLMSSTILGFKPSLCSLVRKHSTVPPLLYHDESTLTKNTCKFISNF